MIEKIISVIKNYRDQQFLKKLGCKNWEEYRAYHDIDLQRDALTVSYYYKNYPYIHCIENTEHEIYDWQNNRVKVITEWCTNNMIDKFRFDYHRVSKKMGKDKNGIVKMIWEFDELNGKDYIFVAFKNPKDYTLFLLVWE